MIYDKITSYGQTKGGGQEGYVNEGILRVKGDEEWTIKIQIQKLQNLANNKTILKGKVYGLISRHYKVQRLRYPIGMCLNRQEIF